jgi:phospholipase/carboxylesterase
VRGGPLRISLRAVSTLVYAERPASGAAQGLLVLHHGRGTDELDLLPLADALDPERRLLVVTPRAPLQLPGSPGYHWYRVPRVGHPDPETFYRAFAQLAELYDELWSRSAIPAERTVLGGFSMGSVMSYALGLGAGRPRPGGILAFSGFIPTVEGWDPQLAEREALPVFIAHGARDPVIPVEFARDASDRLAAAGLDVEYHESGGGHQIDPAQLARAAAWLSEVTRD